MTEALPNLAGVATADLVDKIGTGSFSASYINWSRTLHLLRTHAPGWLPELVTTADGSILHAAPQGAFLLIRFRHIDGRATPEVPQAVMDHRNAAIPLAKITARDITDTHRRGVCMAAALTFGLAYELWAKVALESGYGEAAAADAKPEPMGKINPLDGVWEAQSDESQAYLLKCADKVKAEFAENGAESAARMIYVDLNLTNDEILAVWTQLDSKVRNQSKKFKDQVTKGESK